MNPISNPFGSAQPDSNSLEWSILDYLRDELPGYCFDVDIDTPFVRELLADFPETNVLEEIKLFRWGRNNEPFSEIANQRVVLRRRIAREARRDSVLLRPDAW